MAHLCGPRRMSWLHSTSVPDANERVSEVATGHGIARFDLAPARTAGACQERMRSATTAPKHNATATSQSVSRSAVGRCFRKAADVPAKATTAMTTRHRTLGHRAAASSPTGTVRIATSKAERYRAADAIGLAPSRRVAEVFRADDSSSCPRSAIRAAHAVTKSADAQKAARRRGSKATVPECGHTAMSNRLGQGEQATHQERHRRTPRRSHLGSSRLKVPAASS